MTYRNPLKEIWRNGGTVYHLWSTIPSPWAAELMVDAGFEAITIDMQHGLSDDRTLIAMLQAIGGRVPVLVRALWNDPAHLMRILDAGAQGVICPMISTAAEAEALVGACRYPPHGFRSFGPFRAAPTNPAAYVAAGAESAAVFAMIETAQGLANVAEIARTPGLDGLYIGPADLSLGLGLPEIANLRDPQLHNALQQVLDAAHAAQIVPGCHASNPADAAYLASLGFRLVSPAHDSSLLRAAAREARIAAGNAK